MIDFGGDGQIDFSRQGRAGVITLNRPKALNALSHAMIKAMARALEAWQEDDGVRVVVVRGEGRAFCAGGDVVAAYEAGKAGRPPVDFFADEYRLNAAVARFRKPYVSLIDGVVMGGGFGISGHGSHRVMTDKTVFAMPEVSIGFFPDVGASYVLPRLPHRFGFYLGLTGNRIGLDDALETGLATHAAEAADLDTIADEIARTGAPDSVLARRAVAASHRQTARLEAAERHFDRPTLEACIARLSEAAASGDAFAAETLSTMRTRSPISLHVTFRQLRIGSTLCMDDCMRMEFRIANRMLASRDFYEGIRATLVDKDGTPNWQPATLEEVDPSAIDGYFAPLGERELDL